MSIEKITDAEIAAAAVSRLADRPNRGGTGQKPLSAEELKQAFDALGRLNAAKYNALVESIRNGELAAALSLDGEKGSPSAKSLLLELSSLVADHTGNAEIHHNPRWYTNEEFNLPENIGKTPLLFHAKIQWSSNTNRLHSVLISPQMRVGTVVDSFDNTLRFYRVYISEGPEIYLAGDTVTMYTLTLNADGSVKVSSEVVVFWNYRVEVLA